MAFDGEAPSEAKKSTCTDRQKGLLLALVGILFASPDALLVRLMNMENSGTGPFWTCVAFRSLFIAMLQFLVEYVIQCGNGLRGLYRGLLEGPWHIAFSSMLQAAINVVFPIAFLETTAAKALLLMSLNPLWSAILSRLFIGDILPMPTIAAMLFAFVSICIVLVPPLIIDGMEGDDVELPGLIDGLEHSDGDHGTLLGDAISLLTGFSLAAFVTFNRYTNLHRPKANTGLAAVFGGILGFIITLPVTLNVDQAFWGQLTPGFWGFTAASSVATFLVGILAYFMAPRYARSSEIALVTSLEILLGPTWVFIGLGEVPSLWTFLGGGLLFVTLCLHELVLGLGTVRFSRCHCAHPRRALAGGDVAVAPMSE